MLERARQKCASQGLCNTEFKQMDMTALDFDEQRFDAATGAFCIFFVEKMQELLTHIGSRVKPGGTVLVTTFAEGTFEPLSIKLFERLERHGVELPIAAWLRVASETQCTALFEAAGLRDVSSTRIDCSYHLKDAEEWWEIVMSGGYRGLIEKLDEGEREGFKRAHLEEVAAFSDKRGILLNMPILYTRGTC